MNAMVAYLTFDGNCAEAMKFYQKCLGAELHLLPFSEGKFEFPKGADNRVMHAKLTVGHSVLMASDSMPGMPVMQGNNYSVSLNCESLDEIEKLFSAFAEGAKITMQLQDTFWNARFGMLTDKFGMNWMFNYDYSADRQNT